MIVHLARASDVGLLSKSLSPEIVKLADAYWPGPLTMVLEKRESLPLCVTGGLATVGVRLPDDPVAASLIRLAGTPVAAPSANLSGGPSPTNAGHVIADLDGRVDVILAGGECRVGIESTVVDMTVRPPQILRPGIVTQDDIAAQIEAPVDYDPALLERGQERDGGRTLCAPTPVSQPGRAPRAPGMKYRHYAPKASMVVIEGVREKVRAEICRLKKLNEALGLKVGTLLFGEREYLEAAHDFYAELRTLDDAGVDLILAGALSETDGVGFAVMNRMMKAAGYNVVRV
jgi:L-threonylcarbamoyladenylate synthase